MQLIKDWMACSWELLQIRGWWFAAGLFLCVILRFLPLKTDRTEKRRTPVVPLLWGVLLPVCNFAAIPVATALMSKGIGLGAVFAFLSAAVLLNPAGMLSAWAYMGPGLAIAWIVSALAVSMAVGVAGTWLLPPANEKKNSGDRISRLFSVPVPELAFWLVLGTLAQGFLQALLPELWQDLLREPTRASAAETVMACLVRHVCIPDDTALAASLAATGFPPGWVVLFLTVGICTNLPELFVLYGLSGKKPAALYGLVSIGAGLAAGLAVQLLLGPGFVPQFSLENAEPLLSIASLLTVHTWMPAKIPCTVILLLLAAWGLWIRERK